MGVCFFRAAHLRLREPQIVRQSCPLARAAASRARLLTDIGMDVPNWLAAAVASTIRRAAAVRRRVLAIRAIMSPSPTSHAPSSVAPRVMANPPHPWAAHAALRASIQGPLFPLLLQELPPLL